MSVLGEAEQRAVRELLAGLERDLRWTGHVPEAAFVDRLLAAAA